MLTSSNENIQINNICNRHIIIENTTLQIVHVCSACVSIIENPTLHIVHVCSACVSICTTNMGWLHFPKDVTLVTF